MARVKLLNCWPHLDRKSRAKKGLLIESERYDGIIKPQLDYLSEARSAGQFKALSKLVTENWTDLGESDYAEWLEDEYLAEPWDLWFYSASDVPGIVPNQNPIESHHRVIKATTSNHLRASTGHVLASFLPKLLVECVMDIGSEPNHHYSSGPIPAGTLQDAINLCTDDNHYPTHRRKSKPFIGSIQEYYFNTDYYVMKDDNLYGLKVSASRTKVYKRSLQGILKANEKVENIQLRYRSLHVVKILEQIPFVGKTDTTSWELDEIDMLRHKFKCDCKAFFRTGWLCPHELACLHLVDGFDLNQVLRTLPARKPPGRPRKKTKCLQRDRSGFSTSQNSVPSLVKRLVEKPASVINWSVLMAKIETDDSGEETERTYVGKVRPPFTRGGKRYWDVLCEDYDDIAPLDAEVLARVINFSVQMGHDLTPN